MAIDLSSLGAVPAPANPLEGGSSALGAAARGALGMIPVGEQGYAGVASMAKHTPYLQERDALHKQIQEDIDTQPEARLAGQVAGVAAPIIATGGLAAPESLAGAAGQGALFGGAYGAGNAIDTLASGGSGQQAAGDVALGAGLGAAGGAAGRTLGEFVGGLGRKAAVGAVKLGGEAGEPIAASTVADVGGTAHVPPIADARQAMGATASATEAPAMTQAKQGFFPSVEELKAEILAGQLGGSPRQLRALPGKDIIASLNHMGDVIKANSTPDNPLISMTDRYPDRLRKFIALENKSGKTVGGIIEKAGVPPLPTSPIADELINSAKFLNPSDQAQLQSVIDQLEKYGKLDGTPRAISFKRLQQLKSDLGNPAFKGQGNTVLQGAYHTINDIQDNELEKLGNTINKPEFTNAKQAYQMTSRAIPMLRMATARSLAKGYSAFGAPLAALVTGHPVAALGSMMKEPLQRAAGAIAFGAPELGETIGSVPSAVGAQAAKVAPDVTSFNLQHPALAHYVQTFKAGAASAQNKGEVDTANARTAFKLSQTDPNFPKAQQAAQDNPEATEGPGQQPIKMAEGGLVSEFKENFGKPVPGFGSTLQGLQNVMEGNGLSPTPMEPSAPVRTAQPDEFHQSFNPQMEEQLKAFLMGAKPKGEQDAK